MVDYEKWERFHDESEENGEDGDNLKINIDMTTQRINIQKDKADYLFEEGKYGKSLELYLSIIQEILIHPQLSHLYIPCQLNCSTCFIKLSRWNQCIQICDSLLDAKPCLLTTLQQIRCHFFRATSYFESSKNDSSLRFALKSSLAIQNLIESPEIEISLEDRDEYNLLHQKITAHLQDEKEGWKLISQEKYTNALQWFHDAIHSNPNSADAKDVDLLSSYFEGVGACYEGIKDYAKASTAYERAAELKSTILATHFDELDLPTKNSFQRLILLSAHSSLRATHSTLLSGLPDLQQLYSKVEFQASLKRSVDLFQRLIIFSMRLSDADLHTYYSSLYVSLSYYGMACCYFLVTRYQQAKEAYEKAIQYILKFLSTSPPVDPSPFQMPIKSHKFLLYNTIARHKERTLGYDSGVVQISTLLSSYSESFNAIFHFCLPPRSIQNTFNSLAFHYSLIFDSYLWSHYCSLVLKIHSDTVFIAENFQCWLEKCYEINSSYPRSDQSISAWSLLKQLTIANLVAKCWGYNHLDCVDLEVQNHIYSLLFQHTHELSQHLMKTSPPLIGNYDIRVTWDCYQTYFIPIEFYFKQTKLSVFQLDDSILHNDNYEHSHMTQKVIEMATLGIKDAEKFIRLSRVYYEELSGQTDPSDPHYMPPKSQPDLISQCTQFLSKIHEAYLHLLKLHFWRGLCASDRSQGQRYFECGHTTREEYDRLRHSHNYQQLHHFIHHTKDSRDHDDIFEDRLLWSHDYLHVAGDLSFHLAYTYMRAGKMKYALEEARHSVKCYGRLRTISSEYQPLDYSPVDLISFNSKVEREKRMKLRHSWGLVAVILCNMGSDPKTIDDCYVALSMVRDYNVGPVEESSRELKRLQNILELNKSSASSSSSSSSSSSLSNSPSELIAKHWKDSIEKSEREIRERSERIAEIVKRESALLEAEDARWIDFNLLFSYFFITSMIALFCYVFVVTIPHSFRRFY